MKRTRYLGVALGAILLAFTSTSVRADVSRSNGQRIYVPAYSEVPYGTGRQTVRLSATLSIRNLDPARKLTLQRIDYHDDKGKVVQHYLEEPKEIAPLGSLEFVVREGDRKGGVSASFVIEWRSLAPVVPPLAQCIMITTTSLQGISFLTEGRVIQDLGP